MPASLLPVTFIPAGRLTMLSMQRARSLLHRSDTYNGSFRWPVSDPPALVTSSLVIAEGRGWFLRRYDQQRGLQFLAFVKELPGLAVRSFDAGELAKAARMVAKFLDQKLTLADAHGLVVMRSI